MRDVLAALFDLWLPIIIIALCIDIACYAIVGVAIWVRRRG